MSRSGREAARTGTPCVFLDRDGVLSVPEFREGRSYAPRRLEDFTVYAEARAALERLRDAGFALVVVTNQPDVGAGRVAAETVARMHERLARALPLDAIETCPHVASDGCTCRKPRPGMLLRAARALGLSLADSFMVGDRASDVEAGSRAGCTTVFIDLGYTAEPPPRAPDHTCTGIAAAAEWIAAQRAPSDRPRRVASDEGAHYLGGENSCPT